MRPPYRALTLGIYPSSRGFGWVAFENPLTPYDWGIVSTRGTGKNDRCLKRIERLLDRLQPETLVLEAFEGPHSLRRGRIASLGRATIALALSRSVEVDVVLFTEVRKFFAYSGAKSRYGIAEAIARQFTQFARYIPAKPCPWRTDDVKQSLFSAVAIVVVHYQRDANDLLSRL